MDYYNPCKETSLILKTSAHKFHKDTVPLPTFPTSSIQYRITGDQYENNQVILFHHLRSHLPHIVNTEIHRPHKSDHHQNLKNIKPPDTDYIICSITLYWFCICCIIDTMRVHFNLTHIHRICSGIIKGKCCI